MDKILRSEAAPAKWKCPKCGREFKHKGQDHYCGEKPKSIDEYIESQGEEFRDDLRLLHRILHEALPDAEERISWSMPTYWKGHNILHFAAFKKHIGFYPGPEAVTEFSTELQDYHVDKGTICIPYGKIDSELISKIAKWCWETGNHGKEKSYYSTTNRDEYPKTPRRAQRNPTGTGGSTWVRNNYIKMFYLLATVDYISKKYDIPLCDKYNDIRNMKLEEPFYVGDVAF